MAYHVLIGKDTFLWEPSPPPPEPAELEETAVTTPEDVTTALDRSGMWGREWTGKFVKEKKRKGPQPGDYASVGEYAAARSNWEYEMRAQLKRPQIRGR